MKEARAAPYNISPGVVWEREGKPGFSLPSLGTTLFQPS